MLWAQRAGQTPYLPGRVALELAFRAESCLCLVWWPIIPVPPRPAVSISDVIGAPANTARTTMSVDQVTSAEGFEGYTPTSQPTSSCSDSFPADCWKAPLERSANILGTTFVQLHFLHLMASLWRQFLKTGCVGGKSVNTKPIRRCSHSALRLER